MLLFYKRMISLTDFPVVETELYSLLFGVRKVVSVVSCIPMHLDLQSVISSMSASVSFVLQYVSQFDTACDCEVMMTISPHKNTGFSLLSGEKPRDIERSRWVQWAKFCIFHHNQSGCHLVTEQYALNGGSLVHFCLCNNWYLLWFPNVSLVT